MDSCQANVRAHVDSSEAAECVGAGAAQWMCSLEQWDPESDEIEFILNSVLPEAIQSAEIERLEEMPEILDQAMGIVGHALKYRSCVRVGRVQPSEIRIKRSRGGKPFLATRRAPDQDRPNFNFNISHDGKVVVLVANSQLVCGIDICAYLGEGSVRRRPWERIRKSMRKTMTAGEWDLIDSGQVAPCVMFQKLFSVKEAYLKAVGIGLSIEPGSIEVTLTGRFASLRVAGKVIDRVKCVVEEIGLGTGGSERHTVAVAMIHPTDIVDVDGEFSNSFQNFGSLDFGSVSESATCWDTFEPTQLIRDILRPEFRDSYQQNVDLGLWGAS